MARFVKFPGTAGSYASTDDVNKLDSDTSHLQQSLGAWVQRTGGPLIQSTDLPPVFGDFHGSVVLAGTTSSGAETSPTNVFSVVGSTEYTFSAYMAVDAGADVPIALRILFYDVGDAFISDSQVNGTGVNAFNQLSTTATTPANAVWARFRVQTTDAGFSGRLLYFDAITMRLGTDATFVPSLRIVGDLDMRAKVAFDWASVQSIIGNWRTANNGYMIGGQIVSGNTRISMRYGDGSVQRTASLDMGEVIPADEVHTIRATFVESTGVWQGYLDDIAEGTSTVTTGPGAYDDRELAVGARPSGTVDLFTGDMYWAEVRDGIDGPIVAQFDAEDISIP